VAQDTSSAAVLLVDPLSAQEQELLRLLAAGLSTPEIAAAIFMPLGGALFDRIGARPLVVVGLALVAGAVAMLAQVGTATQGAVLIVPLALSGAGMGLMLMTLNTYLIQGSPRPLVSRVTALTNALQRVVTSLSIAGLATILTARETIHCNVARATFAAWHPRAAGAIDVPPHDVVALLAHELGAAMNAAFVAAFDDTFRVMIVTAVAGAVLALALRRPRAVPAAVADAAAGETGSAGAARAQGSLLAG
jgi:MFS family permease